MDFAVITFRSVQSVMEAEEALKAAGLSPRMVPSPAKIVPGCAAAIRIPFADLDRARAALAGMGPKIQKWLVLHGDVYVELP